MKNVTISLDEKVLRWARVQAAQKDTSLSKLVGEMLEQKMTSNDEYTRAMKQFLAAPALKLREPGQKLPKREQLYDRPVLRRH